VLAQAGSTCFTPASIDAEARTEMREKVVVREVVVLYDRREERSEAVGRPVCALKAGACAEVGRERGDQRGKEQGTRVR